MTIEEKQFEFEGIPVRYYRTGKGFPLLMLHGSGPGASSIGNWRTVLGPLAEHFEIFAMDLIGFGASGRKPHEPYFDYPLWVRQARQMLALILERGAGLGHAGKVGLIGHSLSGSIALNLAADNAHVAGVVTTGSMGAPFAPNEATQRTWTCPTNRQELERALQGLIYDKSVIDDAYISAREPVVFAAGYADYFNNMFQGDQQQYVNAALLPPALLATVRCPVLMMHGRDDTAFPAASSTHIAAQLDDADLMLLARCSHSVAFEHPQKFLALVLSFFESHKPTGLTS